MNTAYGSFHVVLGGVYTDDLPHTEVKIIGFGKSLSERIHDRGCFEAGSSHLVEQRLEGMMVLLIKQNDLYVGTVQRLDKLYTTKAAANHYDTGLADVGNTRGVRHNNERGLIQTKIQLLYTSKKPLSWFIYSPE